MRILSITAGAAGMYCGSCSRDNALAVELLARGHEVTLLPLYTPTTTDETNVSRNEVLFGGISIYLQQHMTLFRNTPRFLDRWWDSPRVIRAFASRSLSTDPKLLGDLTISMLEGRQGVLRKEFDKLLDEIKKVAGGREVVIGGDFNLTVSNWTGTERPTCKQDLAIQARLADEFGLILTVTHYPAGASKWNPIEHRMFSPISENWSGEPLVSYETILKYIRTTRTETGFHCRARMDWKDYPPGRRATREEKAGVRLKRRPVRPELNYTIYPHRHGPNG